MGEPTEDEFGDIGRVPSVWILGTHTALQRHLLANSRIVLVSIVHSIDRAGQVLGLDCLLLVPGLGGAGDNDVCVCRLRAQGFRGLSKKEIQSSPGLIFLIFFMWGSVSKVA